MAERETTRGQLEQVQKRLARWRARHGGRGRPIPDALWAAAATVASTSTRPAALIAKFIGSSSPGVIGTLDDRQ